MKKIEIEELKIIFSKIIRKLENEGYTELQFDKDFTAPQRVPQKSSANVSRLCGIFFIFIKLYH